MKTPIGTDLALAAEWLRQGETVAIPTETVYGLAANALSARAVARIFAVKNRPHFDPLIVHFSMEARIEEYLVLRHAASFERLYERFCPGPLSFIFPKKARIPDLVSAGHPSVAIRFPAHPLAQALLAQLDFPLAAPSANLFGRVSPTTAAHVAEQLGGKIPYILDGGPCSVGLESTIIDLSGPELAVLRLGGLALEELEEALGQSIGRVQTSSSRPQAPGMLSAHYSPGIPVLLGESPPPGKEKDCGALRFCKPLASLDPARQRILSPSGDLQEAAQHFFEALRSFDPRDTAFILAERFPDHGLGRAINDRLLRASVSRESQD